MHEILRYAQEDSLYVVILNAVKNLVVIQSENQKLQRRRRPT